MEDLYAGLVRPGHAGLWPRSASQQKGRNLVSLLLIAVERFPHPPLLSEHLWEYTQGIVKNGQSRILPALASTSLQSLSLIR